MIAYEILVQTIADWRAGVRPTAPSLPPIPAGVPETYDELESGVVDLDDDDDQDAGYAAEAEVEAEEYGEYGGEQEAQPDEAQYAQPDEAQYDQAQYDQAQYDQAQPPATETYEDDEEPHT